MATPPFYSKFLKSCNFILEHPGESHYIDVEGNLCENTVANKAAHRVANVIVMNRLFNKALVEALSNDIRAAANIKDLDGDSIEHICAQNSRISTIADAAFAAISSRINAALITKKEGLTTANLEIQRRFNEDVANAGGSTVSESSSIRDVRDTGAAVATAYFNGQSAEVLSPLIADYKTRLIGSWLLQAEELKETSSTTFAALNRFRSETEDVEAFDEKCRDLKSLELIVARSQKLIDAIEKIRDISSTLGMRALIDIETDLIKTKLSKLKDTFYPFDSRKQSIERSHEIARLTQVNIDARAEALAARALSMEQRAADLTATCVALQPFDRVAITPARLLEIAEIGTPNGFNAPRYASRVSLWDSNPMQRLLVGNRGLPYPGSVVELYTQAVLHSIPRSADHLVNSCFSNPYAILPRTVGLITDATQDFPGVKMRCSFSLSNPWNPDSPLRPALVRALAGEEPEDGPASTLQRQVRGALMVASCDMVLLQTETSAERASVTGSFRRLGKVQEANLLALLAVGAPRRASFLERMAAISAPEDAGALEALQVPVISGSGMFELSLNRENQWYHRYLCMDAGAVDIHTRYNEAATRTTTVALGGPTLFTFNIYLPLDPATHVGLLEAVITDEARGLTVRFHKEM